MSWVRRRALRGLSRHGNRPPSYGDHRSNTLARRLVSHHHAKHHNSTNTYHQGTPGYTQGDIVEWLDANLCRNTGHAAYAVDAAATVRSDYVDGATLIPGKKVLLWTGELQQTSSETPDFCRPATREDEWRFPKEHPRFYYKLSKVFSYGDFTDAQPEEIWADEHEISMVMWASDWNQKSEGERLYDLRWRLSPPHW